VKGRVPYKDGATRGMELGLDKDTWNPSKRWHLTTEKETFESLDITKKLGKLCNDPSMILYK
jgi:ribosomal protein S2